MKGQITDKIGVQHILDAIAEVESYLTGIDFQDFQANAEKRFATIKQIEIIGEACNHISSALKTISSGNRMASYKWFQEYFYTRVFRHKFSDSVGNCPE